MEKMIVRISTEIGESINVMRAMLVDEALLTAIARVAVTLMDVYSRGGKILIAGNGGSAADAQHFAAEIVCTFARRDRKARPAMALHTDTSALTAWANDFNFETFFSRCIEAHGKSGDAVVLISTSGNSVNMVNAVETANRKGLTVIGLLGKGGGALGKDKLLNEHIIVPSNSTARVQESHILLIHILCMFLEEHFVELDAQGK